MSAPPCQGLGIIDSSLEYCCRVCIEPTSPPFDIVLDEIDKISEDALRNYKEVRSGKKTYFFSLEFVGKSFIQATFIPAADECVYHIEYMKDITDNLVKCVDDVSVEDTKDLFKDFFDEKPLSDDFDWEDMNI